METKTMEKVEQLESLGFRTAATALKEKVEAKRKMAIAYEHYRYVREEKIEEFQNQLRDKTHDRHGNYKTLSFASPGEYGQIPPDSVLDKMMEAKERKCFDSFEIAYIRQVNDPILFGRINGCSDRFFIDQWDEDVKIEDILMPNEG